MSKKNCRHRIASHVWSEPVNGVECARSKFCAECDERLSLGESNDEPCRVIDEMAAARMVSSFMCGGNEIARLMQANAWPEALDELAMEWPSCWLAIEAVGGVPSEGALDWDVSRPLAEQWPWNGRTAEEQALASLDGLRASTAAMVESFVELTGPTDQGQPVITDDEAAVVIAQSSHSFMPFAAEDSATHEPWDSGAETKLTDDELTRAIASSPPGSVQG